MKLRSAIALAVVSALVGVVLATYVMAKRASAFEARAKNAEELVAWYLPQIDSLAGVTRALQRQVDTRALEIERLGRAVARIDSLNPPPDTCRPNLAARDALIAGQDRQIVDLQASVAAGEQARAMLSQVVDSLSAALAARPSRYPPLVGRNIGLGAYYDPFAKRGGVAITLNIGGLRL